MVSRNDVTGDAIISKTNSDSYREGYERIFGKKSQQPAMFQGGDSASKAQCGEFDSLAGCQHYPSTSS